MASEETPGELVCTICNNIFKNPRILSCLHTFCYDCIAKQTHDFHIHASCFLCRADFSPCTKNRSSFRPDTYIASQVDLYQLKAGKTLCVVCQLRDVQQYATHYCVDCCDMLCSTCAEHHSFTRLTFEHQVVKRTDVQEGKYDSIILQKRLLTCSEHPCKQLKYYCKSCYYPVCEQCLVYHKKDHEVVVKHDALKKSRATEIERMCSELQPRLRRIMTVQQITKNGIEEIEKKKIELPRKIQSLCDKLKHLVKKNGTEAIQTTSLELTNIKQKLATHKSDVDAYLEKLGPSLKTCETLVSGANTLHILPIADILLRKLSYLATIDRPSDNAERQTLTVEFQTSLKDTICNTTLTRTDVHLTNEEGAIVAASVPIRSRIRPALYHGKSHEQKTPTLVNCTVKSPSASVLRTEKLQQTKDISTKPQSTIRGKTKPDISTGAKPNKNVIDEVELKEDSSTVEEQNKKSDSMEEASKQANAVNAKQATTRNENDLNQVGVKGNMTSSPRGNQSASDLTTVSKYELVRCLSLETLADSRKPAVTSVAWVNSNSFVVSDMDNNKITVFNTNGTVEWSTPVYGLLGVACVKDVIACSRKGYITLLKNKKQTKSIKMKSGSITPLLTRTVDGQFLGTTSYDRNILETFTTSGESKTQIKIKGCSVNMISSNDEWHIVSDWSMNSLFFIDKTSGRIAKEAKLPGPLKLWGHHGGHCTDDNSVLVADYYGQKIIVLSKDGSYLHNWSLPSAIYHPVDQDFHSSGQLIVTGKHHVAIFVKRLS
ncbi:E3 ubiquitin-protein ligase TRIM56-like [Mizuhopecten yessoensis]|uniref:E3 ubiquitin-protein ligase TRIM56-like n=1 Tax=Mizuhopecten yessoensis TaxID=6573 RepID=UPI000B45D40E|nr:E3 ubiquitin-protein ligase TRIM56-like [Mizuhopecten yessoensis]